MLDSGRDGTTVPREFRARVAGPLSWLALAALAGLWSWLSGSRGFFPLDQSLVLDGAWRIHSGQVPIVDFTTSYGLTTIWLQALVFSVFGVSFSSYLLTAALLNAAGVLLAGVAVRRVLPDARGLMWLAGILTGIWYQPLFGTPFPEQTAFFFGLLALTLSLVSLQPSHRAVGLQQFGVGVCLVLAFLAKQNAGLLFVPVIALVLWLGRRRHAFAVLAGLAAAAALFLVWLVTASDPAQFVRSWFETPSELLRPRLEASFPYNVGWVFFGKGNLVPRTVLMACATLATVWLIRQRRREWTREDGPLRVAACLCVALFLYQNLFNAVTNNKPENGYAFTGLIMVFALAVAPSALAGLPRRLPRWCSARTLARAALALLLLVSVGFGLRSAWTRRVHMIFGHSEFDGRVDAPGWSQLRWARPTPIAGTDVRIEDLNAVIAHLRRSPGNFFVFPDFTFLYALLRRPSPQPLLWFHPGSTYSQTYDRALDQRIVRELIRNRVETIVLEERSWLDTWERLSDFPELARLIEDQFEETARYGMFIVRTRR